jgi:hypothetical protein
MSKSTEYKTVAGEMSPIFEFEEGDVFTGSCVEIRAVKTKEGPGEILDVVDESGNPFGIWMTSAFQKCKAHFVAGARIRVTYRGKIKLPKGKSFNDFKIEIAEALK